MHNLFTRDMTASASKSSTELTAAWDGSSSDSNGMAEASDSNHTEDPMLVDTQADLGNLIVDLTTISDWDRRD